MVTILQAGQQRRHRYKEQTFRPVGESKGGMICENSTETCTLPYVKQMTNASSMHEAEYPKPCSGTTQRDRGEREVGGGFGMGDTCIPVTDSC